MQLQFNRHVRRKLNWLAMHTRPKPGKPGQVESKPRESGAFAITENTNPRSLIRHGRRQEAQRLAAEALQ